MFLTTTSKGMIRQATDLKSTGILERTDLDAFRFHKGRYEWLDLDAVAESEADYPELNDDKFWKQVRVN